MPTRLLLGYLLLHRGAWNAGSAPRQVVSAQRVAEFVVVRIGSQRELNAQPDFYREFFARVMATLDSDP